MKSTHDQWRIERLSDAELAIATAELKRQQSKVCSQIAALSRERKRRQRLKTELHRLLTSAT